MTHPSPFTDPLRVQGGMARHDRMLDATKPVPFQGDGYPARNRDALDRKIRDTVESIESARKDDDQPMVAALRVQLAYFKAARANNDGQPFYGMMES